MANNLALYLQAEIDRRGMTSAGLAAKAGIPKPTLHNVIREPDVEPELATLDKLARALGEPLEKLIRQTGYDLSTDMEAERDARLDDVLRVEPQLRELMELLSQQSPDDLRDIRNYLQGWLDGQRRRNG